MSGFSSRQEALIMINVLWARYIDIIKRIVRCRKKGQFLQDLEKTKKELSGIFPFKDAFTTYFISAVIGILISIQII